MKYLPLIIAFIGLINCSISQSELSNNKTFKQTFSETEMQDLQLLFNFFNQSICEEAKEVNLNDCYMSFFRKMETSVKTNSLLLNIPFDEQSAVYENISNSTFQEIWAFNKTWDYREHQPDTFRMVYINFNGKYLEFLRTVGKNDKTINKYYETVAETGNVTPALVADLLVNYNDYNIKDIRVKFIVAIHYLTLNDQFERVERIQ